MTEHTISDLAAEFGVTYRAIRFYEDKGLLHPRRDGERRLYDEAQRERLKIIHTSTRLGFTLAETAEILALGGVDRLPPERRAAQIEHLQKQREQIEYAIRDLMAL
jgi:DNA-binding transcriptional MerR regulator